jgi:hypothetical protein
VVLSELPGGISPCLEQGSDRGILFPHAELGTRQSHLTESGSKHALARNKRRSAGGTTLLTIVVGEHYALVGNTVDVGRLVSNQTPGVGANVALPNIVAPDDENVWSCLATVCTASISSIGQSPKIKPTALDGVWRDEPPLPVLRGWLMRFVRPLI